MGNSISFFVASVLFTMKTEKPSNYISWSPFPKVKRMACILEHKARATSNFESSGEPKAQCPRNTEGKVEQCTPSASPILFFL